MLGPLVEGGDARVDGEERVVVVAELGGGMRQCNGMLQMASHDERSQQGHHGRVGC